MKNVHNKVLKYRKKDNDYGLWMKHQRKLFQGYYNLGCMIWYNLKFLDMKNPKPILIEQVSYLCCKLKDTASFVFKNKKQTPRKMFFLKNFK